MAELSAAEQQNPLESKKQHHKRLNEKNLDENGENSPGQNGNCGSPSPALPRTVGSSANDDDDDDCFEFSAIKRMRLDSAEREKNVRLALSRQQVWKSLTVTVLLEAGYYILDT